MTMRTLGTVPAGTRVEINGRPHLCVDHAGGRLIVCLNEGVTVEVDLDTPAMDVHLLDNTVRELGTRYGRVSGTPGKEGIAFVVASGRDATTLAKYLHKGR